MVADHVGLSADRQCCLELCSAIKTIVPPSHVRPWPVSMTPTDSKTHRDKMLPVMGQRNYNGKNKRNYNGKNKPN